MHQIMKKVWAVLLALCLVIGFMPLSANAALVDADQYVTQQLSLGEDLVLHLRASLPESAASLAQDAVGTLTYAGKTKTYTLDDMTPDESGMYDMAVEMAVAEMTEDIHAVVNAKVLGVNQEIINEHYSIRDYLIKIIDGDYSQTTKDLCLELLNMGAWAQMYFKHNTGNLANADYTTSPANPVPEEIPEVLAQGALDGVQFQGATVRFLSQTAVRFYFAVDGAADGYTFSIDGKTYEPVQKDGMYYIETPGINPQNMSKTITASVSDGTNTVSVEYAPIWYFVRTYNKSQDEYLRALMEAAYSYYKAAEDYKTQICMDVEFTTLGNSTENVELGFYPLGFEGSIHEECPVRVSVKAGTTTTIKVDQGNLLVNGEFLGIGIVVFGGPEWNTELEDGTNDKHAFTITNMRLEGPEDRAIDLRCATVTTGFGGSNSGGTATISNGTLTVTNGICYDGHMITFNEVDTYLVLDMEITTLSNSTDALDVAFYPHGFEGDYVEEYTDMLTLTAGTTNSVYLDAAKYLVDGEIPGIGFVIFGGPAWNTQLEDGTYDRHAITVSNFRLEGEQNMTFDLSRASVQTGFAGTNSGGVSSVADGIVSVTGGYMYDGHMITFVDESIPEPTEPEVTEPEVTEPEVTEPEPTEPEPTEPPVEDFDTTLSLDLKLDTITGVWENDVEIRFYAYDFTGNAHESYTDSVMFRVGEQQTVKLNAEKYMVDGELAGIGVAVFGGPLWNTEISDGVHDRHTVTISNVSLEGEISKDFDLTKSTVTSGTDGTGYTGDVFGPGVITIGEQIVLSDGFQYFAHKIALVEDTNTYVTMDLQIDTLGGDWANDIEIRFYPYNFEGNPHTTYANSITVKAGEKTAVKLLADQYLVDGEIPGIGIGIFGGPAWNTQLEDGTYDRHAITVSNFRLEGEQNMTFDLSRASVQTGFAGTNSGGVASVADGIVSVTGGYLYDGHMITFVDESIPEPTEPEVTEPEVTEPEVTEPEPTEPPVEDFDTTLSLDLKLDTTTGVWENDVEIRFYAYDFTGNAHESYTDSVMFRVGEQQTVKLNAEKYMVDGELAGIGVAVFGGPLWNTEISDGVHDRHTVTISNVSLEGEISKAFDLTKSTVTSGTDGTGYTGDVFGPGIITIGEQIVLSDGFQYFAHKIALVEDTNTYVTMDLQLDTIGGNWDKDIEIRFYPYSFEGNPHTTYTNSITVKAGEKTAVKLLADQYLVDGVLPGIGIGIFGGPEWNTKVSEYVYDRHTVTISSVKLEGGQSVSYDLSQSAIKSGTADTGYTTANGSGVGAFVDGVYQITNGFCYDCHKISLVEDTNTYIVMDLQLDTLSGGWANPIDVRFCNLAQTESVHTAYTDKISVTAGEKVTVKLNAAKYLVDGKLSGCSIAIFGGPEWNTQISEGVYDRHSVVISNLRLEGVGAADVDLSTATVSTGIPGSNTGGTIAIDGDRIVITNGFCYDGYKIEF